MNDLLFRGAAPAALVLMLVGQAIGQEAEAPVEPIPQQRPAAEVPSAPDQPAELEADRPAAELENAPAEPAPQESASVEPSEAEPPAEPVEEPDAEEANAEEPDAGEAVDWAGLAERFPEFFAVTHHAMVHLPIALWLFGALFVVIGLIVPTWRTQIPLACLIGGMLSSIPAIASGWWIAEFEWGNDWSEIDWSEHIVQHRWGAVALLATSAVLSALALVNQKKRSTGLGFVWRAGLIGLALAVGWVGHVGGELVVGEGFFEEALEAWIDPEGE